MYLLNSAIDGKEGSFRHSFILSASNLVDKRDSDDETTENGRGDYNKSEGRRKPKGRGGTG